MKTILLLILLAATAHAVVFRVTMHIERRGTDVVAWFPKTPGWVMQMSSDQTNWTDAVTTENGDRIEIVSHGRAPQMFFRAVRL